MTDQSDGHEDHSGDRRAEWNTDPMLDYPVGPDDAGNMVMHGVGLLISGWHWFVGKQP